MAKFFIHHKVKDFSSWKPVFDAHAATREAAGSKGGKLYRSASDPNDVVIVFDWDSHDKARAFAGSPDLKATMEKAGVVGMPTIVFLDDGESVAK